MKHGNEWQPGWLFEEICSQVQHRRRYAPRPGNCQMRPDADDFFGPFVGFDPRHRGPRADAFRPGFGSGRRARRGALRESVLVLLAQEPMNGYQIMQTLSERTGGIWTPSPGAVYPTLNQLADEGLVVSVEGYEGGSQRVYQLTDMGRTVAEKLNEKPWESCGAATDIPERVLSWKEIGKQLAGLGLAVKNLGFNGTPEQIQEATEIIAEARRKVYKVLSEGEQ
ncbi:MAG: PadR family transcriptional regulator [Propionibacteriaceae bacterium]|jgi:DNA-binding PadR family transcriptional regulator|nr:PadR family transcriptional regulator [Propionibacteriaceae bacterium]